MPEERARKRKRQPVAQTGRPLGPRALRTRQRILDATVELLRERSVLDLPVVDIARRARTSPATFYHYFKDVEEVALALAEEAADAMPALTQLLAGPWDDDGGLAAARQVLDGFLQVWDRHHAVLTLRNLAADRGDRRFMKVRQEAIGPVLDAIARKLEEAQRDGAVSKELHPYATAAALASILERLAAHHRDLAVFGVTRDDIRETCARILVQTLTGKSPDA